MALEGIDIGGLDIDGSDITGLDIGGSDISGSDIGGSDIGGSDIVCLQDGESGAATTSQSSTLGLFLPEVLSFLDLLLRQSWVKLIL